MHDMRKQTQQAEIGELRQNRAGWAWKVVALLGLVLWASGVAPKVLRSNRVRAPGYGIPPPDTGNVLLDWICTVLFMGVHLERRIDPFVRPPIDQYLRDPLSDLVTRLVNMLRKDEGYQLAEERIQPDEEAHIDDIVASFTIIMRKLWNPGNFERGGNTKTHGIVRAEFTVRDDLPEHMRRGIFAKPATYKAWVRYSGPGPYVTPDIDDVGFMSMAIKLMGVPGPKLMDDEKFTQDLLCTSAPTFVSPDTRANAQLHHWSMKNAALIYFFNPKDHHLLDTIMQGCGPRRRPARWRISTSAACRTCSAKARRCSTRSRPGSRRRRRCRGCRSVPRTTICVRRWPPRSPSRTSSSTSFSRSRPIRFSCPSRTPP